LVDSYNASLTCRLFNADKAFNLFCHLFYATMGLI
jgi:hypothetical protein